MSEPLNIFIVSDATGATAEAVVTSALVQFGGAESNIRRFPFIRTEEQVEAVLEQAPERACIIVFTFVSRELSDAMLRLGQIKHLTIIDLMSPLMGLFSIILDAAPSRTPGVFRSESEETFLVTEAIDYTLKHDDGAGIVWDSVPEKEHEETLHKARALFEAIELAATPAFQPGAVEVSQ